MRAQRRLIFPSLSGRKEKENSGPRKGSGGNRQKKRREKGERSFTLTWTFKVLRVEKKRKCLGEELLFCDQGGKVLLPLREGKKERGKYTTLICSTEDHIFLAKKGREKERKSSL